MRLMMITHPKSKSYPIAWALGVLLLSPLTAKAQPPALFGVSDRPTLLTLQAEGAQIYECKPDGSGHSTWAFREPIAALFLDGKTVGRHYAGPTWELTSGDRVKGKVSASVPGAKAGDAPLLKLQIVEQSGSGAFQDATIVLRLNTRGGDLKGPCPTPGVLHAEPYSADYAFLR